MSGIAQAFRFHLGSCYNVGSDYGLLEIDVTWIDCALYLLKCDSFYTDDRGGGAYQSARIYEHELQRCSKHLTWSCGDSKGSVA